MACETCGGAVQMIDSDGATRTGSFSEEYECVNGHRGYVRGRAENPAQSWTRYGQVFDG